MLIRKTPWRNESEPVIVIMAVLLLQEDGSVKMIRRAETPADYFATFDFGEYGPKLAEEAKIKM